MKRLLPLLLTTTRTSSRTPTARKQTTQSTYSLLGEFFANNPALVMTTYVGGSIAAVSTGFAWLKRDIEQTNEKMEQGFRDVRKDMSDIRKDMSDIRKDMSDIRKDISELKIIFFQKQAEDSQQKAEKLEAANKVKPGFWGNSSH